MKIHCSLEVRFRCLKYHFYLYTAIGTDCPAITKGFCCSDFLCSDSFSLSLPRRLSAIYSQTCHNCNFEFRPTAGVPVTSCMITKRSTEFMFLLSMYKGFNWNQTSGDSSGSAAVGKQKDEKRA